MADQPKGSRPDDGWTGVVAEASDDIAEHKAVASAVSEAQVRKPNTALVATLAVTLTVIMAMDIYVATRAPEPLPAAEQEIDLRWVVAGVVDEIEVFRQEQGRLPTAADLNGLLDEVISYEPTGDSYLVSAGAGELRIEYDGSVPLETWVTQRVVVTPDGDGP